VQALMSSAAVDVPESAWHSKVLQTCCCAACSSWRSLIITSTYHQLENHMISKLFSGIATHLTVASSLCWSTVIVLSCAQALMSCCQLRFWCVYKAISACLTSMVHVVLSHQPGGAGISGASTRSTQSSQGGGQAGCRGGQHHRAPVGSGPEAPQAGHAP